MAKRREPSPEAVQSKSLTFTGKQKRRPDLDPVTQKILGVKRRKRQTENFKPNSEKRAGLAYGAIRAKANAEPTGGGGGAWKDPTIYKRKAEAERKAGYNMTLQQFRESPHWTPPPADNFSKGGRTTRAMNAREWVSEKIGDDQGLSAGQSGTSIFDPVLCEIAYRWFCPPSGYVLDPFAGGSVRGIVANRLGRHYTGIDLSERQVQANRVQAERICGQPFPSWLVGDSMEMEKLVVPDVDFVFTCPPYADLEVYSEDPRDLSTMTHDNFIHCYERIVALACERLKEDRFACIVVGDARDAKGFYYGLPWRTVLAGEKAGLRLYNSAILITAAGSLPVRVRKQFEASRKLGTTHQYVLVFCKGDPVKATRAIGPVEFGDIELRESAPVSEQVLPWTLGGEV